MTPASCSEILSNELDARDKVAIAGLVDSHVHLDKCYLLDRCKAVTGDFNEALEQTLQAKKAFTKEDLIQRTLNLLSSGHQLIDLSDRCESTNRK